jgi:hypothetical protein
MFGFEVFASSALGIAESNALGFHSRQKLGTELRRSTDE